MAGIKEIFDVAIKELSLVFGNWKGKQFHAVNPDAQILAIKAKPEGRKTFLGSFAEAVSAANKAEGDNGNGEGGNGAADRDYDEIVKNVIALFYDLAAIGGVNDQDTRDAATKEAIDNFVEELLEDEGQKAGARHSAADTEHLQAIADSHKSMGEHINALGVSASSGNADENGGGEEDGDEKALAETSGVRFNGEPPEEVAAKAADSKKPYGDVQYADTGFQKDKKHRYPIDTEAHARAAWSYINKPKNASKYSSEDLATVKARIKAACKKFGIEVSDEGGKKADTTLVIQADFKEAQKVMVTSLESALAEFTKNAKESQAAVDERVGKVDAALRELGDQYSQKTQQLEAALSAAETAREESAKEAAALKASVESIQATVAGARKPTAQGMIPQRGLDGTVSDPAHSRAAALEKIDRNTPMEAAVKGLLQAGREQ